MLGILALLSDTTTVDYEPFTVGKGTRELKIVHLSDLHFPTVRVDTEKLLGEIERTQADFAVITGDFVNRHANIEASGVLWFAKRLASILPVYYAEGNHEEDNRDIEKIFAGLRKSGVTVLLGESVVIERGDVKVKIIGLKNDSNFEPSDFPADDSDFRLLLAHHPERKRNKSYSVGDNAPDLALTGHAHGGLLRLCGHGVIAPDQSLFPRYTSGRYELSNRTVMIVSRGVGGKFPFRINNHPHVPIITIKL